MITQSSTPTEALSASVWALGQKQGQLTLVQIEQLISVQAPDGVVAQEIHQRGIAFNVDSKTLETLRNRGAGPRTITALSNFLPRASLAIQSTPPDCDVLVDDTYRGRTNSVGRLLLSELPPGEHTVVVRKNRHVSDEYRVTLSTGKQLEIIAKLPWAVGFLTVLPDVPGASIDVERVGLFSGSIKHIDCPPGTYRITVACTRYETVTRMIQVVAGEGIEVPISLRLAASLESLSEVDEILAKNFAARGGLEKIKAIQSFKMTGKMAVQGMELPFTLLSARPDLMRMDMSLQGKSLVQAYDGETAWMINPMVGADAEKLPEDQTKSLKEQGEFDGPLVDYKIKGHTVELIGKEEIKGTEVYRLKVTRSGGDVRTYYIDAKTFLELKTAGRQKVQGQDLDMETFFRDYKSVNGVLVAHSMESKVKGQRFMMMTLENVEANVTVDAATFKMPKKP